MSTVMTQFQCKICLAKIDHPCSFDASAACVSLFSDDLSQVMLGSFSRKSQYTVFILKIKRPEWKKKNTAAMFFVCTVLHAHM